VRGGTGVLHGVSSLRRHHRRKWMGVRVAAMLAPCCLGCTVITMYCGVVLSHPVSFPSANALQPPQQVHILLPAPWLCCTFSPPLQPSTHPPPPRVPYAPSPHTHPSLHTQLLAACPCPPQQLLPPMTRTSMLPP
jgi:hypothetical protein